MGKPDEALKLELKARSLLMQLNAAHVDLPVVFKDELAASLNKAGLLLSTLEKFTEALDSCRRAVSIREKLSEAQPSLPYQRVELATTLIGQGIVQRRASQVREALTSFRRACSILEQLSATAVTPRDIYNQACCHAQIAGIAAAPGSSMTAEQGVAETGRAMAALRQAIAAGYSNVTRLRTDECFDTLRPREEFQKLLKELEAKAALPGALPPE
jgi:tetratricopeptide (TPR) repeat protein